MDIVPKSLKTYASNYTKGECQICYDKNLIIPCKVCEKEACKTCIRRYLLDSDNDTPRCMYCSCVYNRSTLIDMLGKTFVTGEYTKHINKIVVKNQNLLLPTFQAQVTRMLEKNRLKKELDDLNQQMKDLKRRISDVKGEIHMVDFASQTVVSQKTQHCSVDNCNGFLDINFKCGSCFTVFCSDCLEIKLDDHICNEDTKKSVALLNSDTKNCPKCSFAISKIEGCDQMYCTLCNTPFSWKSGNIVTGRIHNPHYFEYLRRISPDGQIRREEGDGQCGTTVFNLKNQVNVVIHKLIINCAVIPDDINRFIDLFENYFISLIDYAISINFWCGRNRTDIDNTYYKINQASIDLISNKIDTNKYEKIITKNNASKIFTNEMLMLNTMLFDVVTDAITKFYQDADIESMVYNLSMIHSKENNIKYVETCIEYHEKAKMFVETLKNDISSIIEYYQEEYWKIKSNYNKPKAYKDVDDTNIAILGKLSKNLDDDPPKNNGLRRQEIINRRLAEERFRIYNQNRNQRLALLQNRNVAPVQDA